MKNYARLTHNGERFAIWQDENSNWCFSYLDLNEVNTGHKELQPALNIVYEGVEERLNPPRTRTQPKTRRTERRNDPGHGQSLLDRLGI